MVLVQAWRDAMGNVYVQPVNHKLREHLETQTGEDCAFLQQGLGAEDFIDDLPLMLARDIRCGWTVQFQAEWHEVCVWYNHEDRRRA